MSRPFVPRNSSSASFFRVNGKIRAREVRVVSGDGKQLGILALNDALNLARQQGVDLVEIAATATPPVCRLVDYGKFRYEQSKKDKESKKHQHATTVKEVQLSPRIDPHDLGVKTQHAIEFLNEDMKVKVVLKFRGREMAHTEFGFQVISKFLQDIAAYGHPDFEPKLVGKGVTVMVSPLPRNKRVKAPAKLEGDPAAGAKTIVNSHAPNSVKLPAKSKSLNSVAPKQPSAAFGNSPFAKLDLSVRQESQKKS